jgi:long-chain acyl-CoA synthetase
MSLALASILAEAALRHRSRTAIVCGEERLTYGALWLDALRYAAFLKRSGIAAGDRVALLIPNIPDFPRAYFGALAAGAAVVPVHALLTAEEIAYVLADSGAKLIVAAAELLPRAQAGARLAGISCIGATVPGDEPESSYLQRAIDDEAVILYTSGTTGKPKRAVLTQANLALNATIAAFDLFGARAEDVFLGALPLFHSFGQTSVMNCAFRVGACVVLMPRFDGAAALDLMVRENVTVFEGVPTMYIALLDAAAKDTRRPPLRLCASGGAPLPISVLEKFEATFATLVYEGYGLSETSPIASFNQRDLGRKPGTVGRGIWGVDLEIAASAIEDRIELLPPGEIGEVVIRGHCVFKGYLNDPCATRAAIVDGWLRSGDLGTKDEDGFITIVDRKKDMILRGGFSVYPREVEEVLMHHPGVKQVAVVGIPHETLGEEIVAVIVRQTGADLTEAAIVAWSQEHLARHKYPRHVRFVDAMPLGPSGKVLKRELRASACGRIPS